LPLGYSVYRFTYPDGFAEAAGHTQITIGTANTAILLTSSFVAWAVVLVFGVARLAAILFAAAAVLGCVFLVLKGIEYQIEYDEHVVPEYYFMFRGPNATSAGLFFSFYFIATAVHALHVAIGIAVLIVIALKARRGAYSDHYHAPVIVAGLYWHFVASFGCSCSHSFTRREERHDLVSATRACVFVACHPCVAGDDRVRGLSAP
jgi:cytochrome c oxidase subunit 3